MSSASDDSARPDQGVDRQVSGPGPSRPARASTLAPRHLPTWGRTMGVALLVALVFGALAVVMALVEDLPLRDPDGLLGPSYVRLPVIAGIMMVLDVVPRVLLRWRRTGSPRTVLVAVVRQRLSGRRLSVVAAGMGSFYVCYVAYRNLKSFLPFVREDLHDPWLVRSDLWFTGGTQPGDLLHELIGTGISADVLSFTYMFFLPFVPFSLAATLVWSENLSRGAWYATALCFNWVLGTASYYVLPALGPIYVESYRFLDLPRTAVTGLQEALYRNRIEVLADPHATQSVHGIAAFGSLHTSIVLTAALVVHMSGMHRILRASMWVFFVLTTLATVYFGWHYLLDVVAGVVIAGASVWLGALATGWRPRPRAQVEAVPA